MQPPCLSGAENAFAEARVCSCQSGLSVKPGAVPPDNGVMGFDMGHLYASLVVSLIGYGYFMYGRKQSQTPFLIAGAALMGFGYFVPSLLVTALIASALAAAPFFFR